MSTCSSSLPIFSLSFYLLSSSNVDMDVLTLFSVFLKGREAKVPLGFPLLQCLCLPILVLPVPTSVLKRMTSFALNIHTDHVLFAS